VFGSENCLGIFGLVSSVSYGAQPGSEEVRFRRDRLLRQN